jgi:TRAP-type C4-dicarboxylate transport system permease small subunit
MTYRLGRLLSRCIDIIAIIAGLLIAVMMVQVAVDVVARYIFNRPLPGTAIFISQYYMLVVVFLPLALPERTNSHISVEIVTEHLPRWMQYHMASWIHLYSALIYGALAWASWGEAVAKFGSNARLIESGVSLPIWPGYFFVPIGCALMAVVLLYRFIIYLTGWNSGLGETPVTGAPNAPKASAS